MDVTSLDPTIQRLLQAGLAPATQRTYGAGRKKYLGFCQQAGLAALPATEQRLMQFIAYAVNQGLKHQTIKSYLSAICHLQVSWGGWGPKNRGHATGIADVTWGEKGTGRDPHTAPPPDHTSHTPKAPASVEQGCNKLGQHHALGSLLSGFCWVLEVRRADSPGSWCI